MILIFIALTIISLIFFTLYVVYRVLKGQHLFISSVIDVLVIQFVNVETIRLLDIKEVNADCDLDIYNKYNFKIFLLYLCYCIDERNFENNLLIELNKLN